jgi:hypothetical protein
MATADGVDVTGQLINPDLEEVVPGLAPRGWLLSATPFGAEYSLDAVADAAAGQRAAEQLYLLRAFEILPVTPNSEGALPLVAVRRPRPPYS